MEDCKDCTTWEESMYWKHFNTLHFTLVLPPDFHDQLVLPKKFAQHMKSHLPEKMSLKGPSGALWEVELFKTDELCFVGSEWKDFIKAHDLKENCRLMFKFKRNSIFEVLIFEQGSCCEKESTYFVKKCRHLKSDDEDHRKRVKGDDNTKVVEGEGEENTTFVVTKKSRRGVRSEVSAVETQTTRVPYAARIRKERSRKVQAPVSRKESIINEAGDEPIQVVQGDVIAPENGESLPKNDRSQKLKTRSRTNLNKNNVAEEIINQVTRDLLTSENGENSQTVNHSHQKKSQSEKQPNGNHTEKDSNVILGRELITPLSGESNGGSDDLHKSKPQSEEPSGNVSAKKQTQNSGRVANTPDYRESSPEEDHSPKSRGTRGKSKKKENSKSSKKLEFKSEGCSKENKSSRRSVSDKEIREAFQKATRKETENSFTTILPKSSVYKRFYLSVPRKWLHDHLPRRNQEIVLRVGDETWSTTLFYQGKKGGGLSSGWKKFALDNNLEESDVLVFKLSSPKDTTPILLDVDIFRVVPITPPPVSETS